MSGVVDVFQEDLSAPVSPPLEVAFSERCAQAAGPCLKKGASVLICTLQEEGHGEPCFIACWTSQRLQMPK